LQVKKSIKKPTTGWAGITHENIGKVVGINLMPPHGLIAYYMCICAYAFSIL